MKRNEIQIRDPYILPVAEEGVYYLYGTTDSDPWKSRGTGFDTYRSIDLENWEGPFPAFRPAPGFWGTDNFWAPEVHKYENRYFMFASFIAEGRKRGTQILVSGKPEGPFTPHGSPVTPTDWQCLDGTLYLDHSGSPWMIFCREWVEVYDGEICSVPLSRDLGTSAGTPEILFRASEASWTKSIPRRDGSGIVDARVTDGPILHRKNDGTLLLLWSSLSETGYAMGYARSKSGEITGPWIQNRTPLLASDGGHGMVFRSFDGRLMITYHSPNKTPLERFHYQEVRETDSGMELNPAKSHTD